jgi:hypothetical protein
MDEVVFQSTEVHKSFPPTGSTIKAFNTGWVRNTNDGRLRCYNVIVPRSCLDGKSTTFADFRDDTKAVTTLGLKLIPKVVVTLLQAIQNALTQPKLHSVPKPDDEEERRDAKRRKKDKNSGGGGEEEDDEDAAAAKKKKEHDAAKANRVETFKDGDDVMNRVEIGIEDLLDVHEMVVGWRIWYFIIDHPKINLPKALIKLFAKNAKTVQLEGVKRRIRAKDPSMEALMICSAKEWIEQVMQYYQPTDDEDELLEFALIPEAQHEKLSDSSNPAHVDKWLNFKQSCKMVKFAIPEADPVYSNRDAYLIDPQCITFPGPGIRMLTLSDRRPAVLHHAVLVENSMTRQRLGGLSRTHEIRVISETQERCVAENLLYSNSTMDVIEHARTMNQEMYDKLDRRFERQRTKVIKEAQEKLKYVDEYSEEYDNIRSATSAELERIAENRVKAIKEASTSPATIARLNAMFASHANFPPGYRKCVEWTENEKMKALGQKKTWSAMCLKHSRVDKNMSFFAHMGARALLQFENSFGIGTLQGEMYMVVNWRYCALDSRKKPLYPHLLVYGPAASGKTNLHRKLMAFSCDGTYRKVSHDTEKAYTGEDNFDALIFLYDEMPDKMINPGIGGQGDPLFKTLLSENEITTTMMVIDPDTKTRTAKEFVCRVYAALFVLTNVTEDKMPEPIASRLFTVETVRHGRMEIDFLLKDEEINTNPMDTIRAELACQEFKIIQAMISHIEVMARSRFAPFVFQRSALLRWNLVKTNLTKIGLLLEPRKDNHIMSFTRTVTLGEACTRLFFTTDVFKDAKTVHRAFKYEHLLKMRPFLFSTEEHLVYAITACEHCITDSNADEVLRAVLALCKTSDGRYTYKEDGASGNGKFDYSYFRLDIPGVEIKSEVVLQKAVEMVCERVCRMTKKHVLTLSIEKVLKRMLNATIQTAPYVEPVGGFNQQEMEALNRGAGSAETFNEGQNPGNNNNGGGGGGARSRHMPPQPQDQNGRLVQRTPGQGSAAWARLHSLMGPSSTTSTPPSQQQQQQQQPQGGPRFPNDDPVLEGIDPETEEEIIPVMRLRLTHTKCALEISRRYLLGAQYRKEGFLVQAIRDTFSKHTKARRMVLGSTYRDQDKMVPFVFRTIDAAPNDKPTRVRNLRFRSPGYEKVYVGEDEEVEEDEDGELPVDFTQISQRQTIKMEEFYETLDEDMDTHFYKQFLKENYLDAATPDFPVCTTWKSETATYPENIITKYLDAVKDDDRENRQVNGNQRSRTPPVQRALQGLTSSQEISLDDAMASVPDSVLNQQTSSSSSQQQQPNGISVSGVPEDSGVFFD